MRQLSWLSQMAEYLDSNIGSLEERDHRDYCVGSVYQNDHYGLQVQQAGLGASQRG